MKLYIILFVTLVCLTLSTKARGLRPESRGGTGQQVNTDHEMYYQKDDYGDENVDVEPIDRTGAQDDDDDDGYGDVYSLKHDEDYYLKHADPNPTVPNLG